MSWMERPLRVEFLRLTRTAGFARNRTVMAKKRGRDSSFFSRPWQGGGSGGLTQPNRPVRNNASPNFLNVHAYWFGVQVLRPPNPPLPRGEK